MQERGGRRLLAGGRLALVQGRCLVGGNRHPCSSAGVGRRRATHVRELRFTVETRRRKLTATDAPNRMCEARAPLSDACRRRARSKAVATASWCGGGSSPARQPPHQRGPPRPANAAPRATTSHIPGPPTASRARTCTSTPKQPMTPRHLPAPGGADRCLLPRSARRPPAPGEQAVMRARWAGGRRLGMLLVRPQPQVKKKKSRLVTISSSLNCWSPLASKAVMWPVKCTMTRPTGLPSAS
jgi:hypothetical protein